MTTNTPSSFEPLTTDYDVTWVGRQQRDRIEGESHEHAYVHLDNGYSVSLLRAREGKHQTTGYDQGLWEAMVVQKNTDPLGVIFGWDYIPTTAADGFATHNPDADHGTPYFGDLDNAGINALIAQVSALPQAEVPTEEQSREALDAIFGEAAL